MRFSHLVAAFALLLPLSVFAQEPMRMNNNNMGMGTQSQPMPKN